jgi:hypothetical protein
LSLICRSCTHCGAILQGRSYLKPDSICASCGGLLPNLTPEKVAELLAKQQRHNSPSKNHSSSSDSASKLIDCQDCGTRISRLAAACPTCGRAGQAALKQGTNTKIIFFVISMAVSWTIVQFISSIREEGRKDRSIKANLELQRTINDPRATEGDYRRAYEKVLNP